MYRNEFTRSEANEIRQILTMLRASNDILEQKSYRHKLRTEYDFYIRSYRKNRMTVADFDLLVEQGRIKIR